MENKKPKHSKPMSKEEIDRMKNLTDKSITVALNEKAGEYYLYFKGDGNLTFNETMVMWGHFTDWIVNRARDLGEESYDEVSLATHTIRHFAQKAIDLGKEEAIRIDGIKDYALSEELVIEIEDK